jgi:hypothetical protein
MISQNRAHTKVFGDYCIDFKTEWNINKISDRSGERCSYDRVLSMLTDEEKAVLETITK